MTKRKQNKEDVYTIKEVELAVETVGNIMHQCSNDIWDVIEKYHLSSAMLYGVLESIKLTIANDIYSTPPEDIHVCTDCKETYKEGKSSLKKVKEVDSAMYR